MEGVSQPSTTPARPPQVTVASGIVIVGSLFVVLQMWDRVAGLHSLDTRTTLTSYLAGSRLGDAGVDVSELTTVVRIAAMAAAGCATATLVLGWQVTRRSRGARSALSVLAGVLLVAGLVSDWFVESVAGTFWACGVGAAVMTLWLGPAGAWFSDTPSPRDLRERTVGGPTDRRPPRSAPPAVTPPPPRLDVPTPPRPSVQPPPMQQAWPPTAWPPPRTSAYAASGRPRASAPRPPALLVACIVTWCCTAFAALILVVAIVTLAQDARPVLDEAYRQNPQLSEQGFSEHELLVMLYAVIGLLLAGSMAAAAFAVVLFRGRRWGWYALLVAAGASTLFFLVGTLGSPVGLLPVIASLVTIACLVRPEVRGWAVRR
jgi:hypothetical protein